MDLFFILGTLPYDLGFYGPFLGPVEDQGHTLPGAICMCSVTAFSLGVVSPSDHRHCWSSSGHQCLPGFGLEVTMNKVEAAVPLHTCLPVPTPSPIQKQGSLPENAGSVQRHPAGTTALASSLHCCCPGKLASLRQLSSASVKGPSTLRGAQSG